MFIDAQIKYLLYLQELRDILGDGVTTFFLQVTKLGEYLIPFSVFAVIYWCINKRIGIFLILSCGFSMMLNLLIKNVFCIYRPWVLDARVKPVEAALKYAGGYSFPSGHTTIAVTCWGAIGVFWRRIAGLLWLMLAICFLVAFSRSYVGVHTLQDVLAAVVVAVFVLLLGWKVLDWVEKGKKRDVFLTLAVTILSFLVSSYIYYKAYPHDYANGIFLVDTHKCKLEAFSKLGFVLGGFWGWLLERRFINFDECCETLKKKLYRSICGLVPLFLLLGGLALFCKWLFEVHCACFCGLFIISFYITFIYPFIFSKFF